jgi:PAS domain S-box-containing protein
MGIITAASQSIEEIFGFDRSKVIGQSINNLMPSFMAEEHYCIMSEWAKSGTWRTIGKLK